MYSRAQNRIASVKRRVAAPARLRLRAEALEPRRMLAGNVTAVVSHGTLLITGDNANNFLQVIGTPTGGQFIILGLADSHGVGTTINHSSAQTFNGVTNVSASLKGGDDFFSFQRAMLAGNLAIDMGDGSDQVFIGVPTSITTAVSLPTVVPLPVPLPSTAVTINGSLCVNLGSGNNSLTEGSTHVLLSETVTACDGNDEIDFEDAGGEPNGFETLGNGVTVDRDLLVDLGGGKNGLDAYDLTVNGSFKVNGSGQNSIELAVVNVAKDAVFNLCGRCAQDFFIGTEILLGTPEETQQNHVGGDLIVNTGCGNDTVTEASLMVGGSNKINTDGGNDAVNLGDTEMAPDGSCVATGGLTVAKDLIVNLGCGVDSLVADQVRVGGTLSVVQGDGDSTITIRDSLFNALKITTGGGKDAVTLDTVGSTIHGTAQINLGSGNDTLLVRGATISTSTFDGGSGVNTYTDGGGNNLPNLTKLHFT